MKTVIEMAREAEIHVYPEFEEAFERFAELVRADAIADEREACAKLVDYWEAREGEHADAIRARGNT